MKKLLASSLLVLSLVGCKSSGNGGGAPGYTHNQLAKKFVQELNLDSEFNVTLTKQSTLQDDYVVIYDPYTDTYDAINIDLYDPALDNAADYYFSNSGVGYFNLDLIPGYYTVDYEYTIIGYDYDGNSIWGYEPYEVWTPTVYRDRYSGITFEKSAASVKDLAKVAALTEVATIDKSAQFLSSEFGLSLNRGKEVARLAAHWKKASKKGMTNAEQDSFSTELLGFSISQGMQAATTGDATSLSSLVEAAAAKNGITPEHAGKLMGKVFGL